MTSPHQLLTRLQAVNSRKLLVLLGVFLMVASAGIATITTVVVLGHAIVAGDLTLMAISLFAMFVLGAGIVVGVGLSIGDDQPTMSSRRYR